MPQCVPYSSSSTFLTISYRTQTSSAEEPLEKTNTLVGWEHFHATMHSYFSVRQLYHTCLCLLGFPNTTEMASLASPSFATHSRRILGKCQSLLLFPNTFYTFISHMHTYGTIITEPGHLYWMDVFLFNNVPFVEH